MLSKSNRWIFVLLATVFVVVLASRVSVASAARPTASPANSCQTCHEDLYYLHDTGKWYCIVEHKDRCANCHEGNVATMAKDESHKGLIVHPQGNNGEKCQQCHPQDKQARLTKFASLGGYKTIRSPVEYVQYSISSTALPSTGEENQFIKNLPWALGGCLAFGLWLVLVLSSPLKP